MSPSQVSRRFTEEMNKKYAHVKQEDLTKIGSVSDECNKLKQAYDKCFMDWYLTEFLKGSSKPDMVPCEALFKDYNKCVKRAMRRLDISMDPSSCPIF